MPTLNIDQTIPHAETLWPEQETRKIPVDRICCVGKGWGSAWYSIVFKPGSKSTHRKEFATLRKEVKEFKTINPQAYQSYMHDTVGEYWILHPDVLRKFADWMEIPGDLDTLIKCAVAEHEEQERERKRKEKEANDQYEQEALERRVPCPSPCKVRVAALSCVKRDRDWFIRGEPGNYTSFYSAEEVGTYAIKLAKSSTRGEQDAHELFCKEMLRQQEHKDFHYYEIQGSWRDWSLGEFTLLAYSDWLEFPAPNDGIENILVRAKAEYEARQEEEYKRWYERQSTDDGAFGGFFGGFLGSRSQSPVKVRSALQLFGIDAEYVKKQYRILAKQTHPDTGGDAEQFKRVNEAYQVLLEWTGNGVSA